MASAYEKVGSAEKVDAGVTLLSDRRDIFCSEDPDIIELTLFELREGLIHRASVRLPAWFLGQKSDLRSRRDR